MTHRSGGHQEEALAEVGVRWNRNNIRQPPHGPRAAELPHFDPVARSWRHLLQRIRCQALVQVRVQADGGGGDNAGEHNHIHHRNNRSDHEAVVERPSPLPGGRREHNEAVAEAGRELRSSAAVGGVLRDNRVEAVARDILDDTGESSRDHRKHHHRRHHVEDSDPVVRGWCRCCYRHWDPRKQTAIRTRR